MKKRILVHNRAALDRTASAPYNLASTFLAAALLISLASCTSGSNQPAPPPKEEPKTELLTGRIAFQKMFVAGRGWARDAQPYRIESYITADANGHEGKAALWRASFGSPSMRATKPWVWSGSIAPDAPARGVNPGTEDSYSPANASTQIFDSLFLKIDSEQAFAAAQKHGGEKVLEKASDTPVTYVCDWNHNTNELVWHVIYGPRLRVAVNASTGEFLRVEK